MGGLDAWQSTPGELGGHIDLVHEDPGNECPCRNQIEAALWTVQAP
jgi:hypothetical protein